MIKIGDMVRLNSGGPQMTVTEMDGDELTCKWFDSEQASHEDEFPLACVKPLTIPLKMGSLLDAESM